MEPPTKKFKDSRVDFSTKLPEELLIKILPHVHTQSLSALCLVSRKLRRISTEFLYERVDVDYSKDSKMPLDDSGQSTERNVAILSNIVRWTKELRFLVRIDEHPARVRTTRSLIKSLRECKRLEILDMSGSQLDLKCWKTLDTLLNGTPHSSFQTMISRIEMPILKYRECFARFNSVFVQRRTRDGGPSLDIASGDRFLEFQSRHNRTISIAVYGAPMEPRHQATFGTRTGWGTDMSTVRKFVQHMRAPAENALQSYGTRNLDYREYRPVLSALGLGPANQLLYIASLTLANVSLHRDAENESSLLSLPYLRELTILGSGHMAPFLEFLISTHQLRLETFRCVNPRKEWEGEDTNCLEPFLTRIFGLKSLCLLTAPAWEVDLNTALARHTTTLRNLQLRFGEDNMTLDSIATVAKRCPQLTSFGFQLGDVGYMIQHDTMKNNTKC